jgi:membrane protease YdiL (CAAX protease family)
MSRPLREVATFLAIAFLLAIGVATALPNAGIGVVLSAMIPITTVAVITFTSTPRGRRRALWGSFGLRRPGLRVWWIAVLVPMAMAAVTYAAAVLLGTADLRSWSSSHGLLAWALNVVVSLASMAVIFLGEEIGWRGYLLPRVQQLTSRRRAALVTGFIHGCFHLPLILIATTYDEFGARWFVAPMVVATLTMGGVFYAYLWDRTRSVWPVALAHGAVNSAFGWGAAAVVGSQTDLAYVAGESGLATFVVAALVGAALLARARVWRVAAGSAVAEEGRPVPLGTVV